MTQCIRCKPRSLFSCCGWSLPLSCLSCYFPFHYFWPLVNWIEKSPVNQLIEFMILKRPSHSLKLTVPPHHHEGIYQRYLHAPQPQCPPTLLILLKELHSVHQYILIRNIVLIHLKVIFIRHVEPQEVEFYLFLLFVAVYSF